MPVTEFEIQETMDKLRSIMQNDPGYAWSWHCHIFNVAVLAGADRKQADEQAAEFMKNMFDVDTRTKECMKNMFGVYTRTKE